MSSLNINTANGGIGGTTLSNADSIWVWDSENNMYTKFILGGAALGPREGFWLNPNNFSFADHTIKAGAGLVQSEIRRG